MLKSAFAKGILLCKLAKRKAQGKDAITEEDLAYLEVARKCFYAQRCGIQERQEQAIAYIKGDEKADEVFYEPGKINCGYALIYELFDWYHKPLCDYKFDEQGNLINFSGVSLDRISAWQESLGYAKDWLIENKMYIEFEKNLLEPILNAKTAKEYITSIKSVKQEDLTELMKRYVTYNNIDDANLDAALNKVCEKLIK